MFSLKTQLYLLATAVGAFAAAGQLVEVTNYGPNPTGVGMFVYKPAKLLNPLPLVIAMHECTASAQIYFSSTQYANLADEYGYLVVYPNSPAGSGGCWDVHTNATLTHNAGGDSLGIASQARYAIANYGVDENLVYATGTSSGAMMTSVLMGAYPDIFAAGSLFSGVPYGCFEGASTWNSQCSEGELIQTPQQWGDLVREGYPGYTGPRPKVQFWHGTADTTLYPQNFWEEIKQWTNVFNISQTPTQNITNDPLPGYSRASFGPLSVPDDRASSGPNVQGILAQGVGHTVPEQAPDVLDWFGITNGAVVGPTGPTTTPTGPTSPTGPGNPITPPTSPPSTPTGGTAPHWAQCGGIGYTGPTVCAAPYTCQESNPYYSQCL